MVLCNKMTEIMTKVNNSYKEHVYYNPPQNLSMRYPCVLISRDAFDNKMANNKSYIGFESFTIKVMSERSDNPIIKEILELPYTKYDRHYIYNGLHHDIITIKI